MEEIEVVINITKHEWEYLNKLVENGDQLGHYERLLVNGTPLPKGHGRLIDADKLLKTWYDDFCYDDFCEFMSRAELNSMNNVIKNAPTIIEADKN